MNGREWVVSQISDNNVLNVSQPEGPDLLRIRGSNGFQIHQIRNLRFWKGFGKNLKSVSTYVDYGFYGFGEIPKYSEDIFLDGLTLTLETLIQNELIECRFSIYKTANICFHCSNIHTFVN